MVPLLLQKKTGRYGVALISLRGWRCRKEPGAAGTRQDFPPVRVRKSGSDRLEPDRGVSLPEDRQQAAPELRPSW